MKKKRLSFHVYFIAALVLFVIVLNYGCNTVRINFKGVKKEEDIAHKEDKKHKEEEIILSGGFIDDFNAQTLDGRWYWVRENSKKWSLTKKTGFLSILPENNNNVLLTNTTETNFLIDVKLKLSPYKYSQRAGIVVFLNKEAALEKYFSTNENTILIALDYEYTRRKSIVFAGNKPEFKSYSSETVYLRMVKKGGKFTAFYSEDGERFKLAGEYNNVSGENLKVGLFGIGPPTACTAYFDYIRFFAHHRIKRYFYPTAAGRLACSTMTDQYAVIHN